MKETRAIHGYNVSWSTASAMRAAAPRYVTELHKEMRSAPSWLRLEPAGAGAERMSTRNRSSVDAFSRSQVMHTSLPALLHWEDRASMTHSVESRVPFLDYRLVELALSLPSEYKISHGVTKRVLRSAVSGVVPAPVTNRMDKLGFQTPEVEWLVRHPAQFRELMASAIAGSKGVLGEDAQSLLNDMIHRRRPFSFIVWRLITFGAWMRRFDVQPA